MTGYLLVALGLLAVGGLLLVLQHRELAAAMDRIDIRCQGADDRSQSAAAEVRRAHVRIDNQQRQLKAITDDLAWTDDRAHTRVLTQPVLRDALGRAQTLRAPALELPDEALPSTPTAPPPPLSKGRGPLGGTD
jgi:hypothetical protein